MLRRDEFQRFAARISSAGMLATILAATAAEAALPTGGMLLPRPKGPSRNDMPSNTAMNVYRVPSATAYGMTGVSEAPASADMVAVAASSPQSPVSSKAAERQPQVQPRVQATLTAATEEFAQLTPTSDASLQRNPFDATVEAAPVSFVDFRDPETIDSTPAEPADLYAGLKGICPVTLREERRVVTPRKEFTSLYGGRCFEFATADAQAAFDTYPERYVPVLGGRDVVLTASGAGAAIGSLKHAGFYRERLYLFESEESCKTFYENPRRYVVRE